MSGSPKISIIIPVFNASLYLEQCIQSVLGQTFDDLEVIAVNDGSTDGSGTLLDAMAAKDSRLRVFHSVNKGVSAARNLGLELARGQYIGFVDSDDWIEQSMYETLYGAALSQNADWVVCNVHTTDMNDARSHRLELSDGDADCKNERQNLLIGFMHFKYDYANWNKLYSAKLIKKNSLRFEESMFLWEDLLFNLNYLFFSERVSFVNKPLYHYRIQPASLTNLRKEALVPQFNLFFAKFKAFARAREASMEWAVFQKQMARGCYNSLLHQVAVDQKGKSKTLVSFLVKYYRDVKKIDPEIFNYHSDRLNGLQGLKKILLMSKAVFLFSLIVTSTMFFKTLIKPVAS